MSSDLEALVEAESRKDWVQPDETAHNTAADDRSDYEQSDEEDPETDNNENQES